MCSIYVLCDSDVLSSVFWDCVPIECQCASHGCKLGSF